MALRTKTREQLYQLHDYRLGRCEVLGLRGYFHTIEKVQGHNVLVPDLTIATFAAQTSTPSAAVFTATGRLYFIWAASGTKSAAGTTALLDAIVQVTDNNVVVASSKIAANQAMEAYFYNTNNGVGISMGTNLKVLAVAAADGISNPNAVDRPDILVVYGVDSVNTEDANLINTIYG